MFVRIISISAFFMLVGCGDVVGSLLQGESTSNQSISYSVTEKKISASSGGSVSVDDAELSGTSLYIPAGVLASDATLSVVEGEKIATSDSLENLSISGNSVVDSGPAVVVTASVSQDASSPMSLSIPILASASLTLNTENYAILYKVIRASESDSLYLGVIPPSDVTIKDGKATFETKYFGVFQAIKTATAISAPVEVKTAEPIAKKISSTSTQPPDISGVWLGECREKSEYDESTASYDTYYETETLKFGGDGTFVMKGRQYSDSACTSLRFSMMLAGQYKVGGIMSFPPGAKELDVLPSSISFTIWDSADVHGDFCGRTVKVGEAITFTKSDFDSMSSSTCELKDEVGGMVGSWLYLGYKIDGSSLYFTTDPNQEGGGPSTDASKRGTEYEQDPLKKID